MIHKITKISFILAFLLSGMFQLTSCKEESDVNGSGKITFGIDFDTKTEPVIKVRSAVTDDYNMIVKNESGNTIRRYETKTDIPSDLWLPSGKYTAKVTAGTNENAAFDAPYYEGIKEITITSNETTQAPIICYLANAKVSVNYSETIKKNFEDYRVTVKSGAASLVFDKNATVDTEGFFKMVEKENNLSWQIDVTNKAGESFSKKGDFTASARRHYIISFNIDDNTTEEGEGGLIFNIKIDDDARNPVNDVIEVPLNKLPEVEGVGFDIEKALFVPYGKAKDVALKITALPTIKSIEVTHDCPLLLTQNIPATFDLFKISDKAKKQLTDLGMVWGELTSTTDETTWSISNMVPNLDEGTYHFIFKVADSENHFMTYTFTMLVVKSDVMTLESTDPLKDIWTAHATLHGGWATPTIPEGLVMEWQKAGESKWKTINSGFIFDEPNKKFSVKLTNLEANTTYNYRVSANDNPANILSITTDNNQTVPNLNFDTWIQNGDPWYPNADLSDANYWWDSGNKGANTATIITGVRNPTSPESNDVYKKGGKAARLASDKIVVAFAAGNVYTGKFGKTIGTDGAELNFGHKYTSRPSKLKGYYKYTSGKITDSKLDFIKVGQDQDSCTMYIALFDWSAPFTVNTASGTFVNTKLNKDGKPENKSMIALGEFKSNTTVTSYSPLEIDITYFDNRRPTYILIVASASKYGDYFTGSTSSVMLLDEFELVFE